MSKRIRRVLAVSALLVVAACGGDDDDAAGDNVTASTEAVAAEEAGDDSTVDSVPVDSATDDTTTGEEASEQVADIGVDSGFCAKLDEVSRKGEELFTDEPSSFADNADTLIDLIRSLVDDAPEELKPDLETTADAFEKMAPLMGEMNELLEDPTNPDNQARLEEIGAEIDSDIAGEADAASQRISAYATDKCGLEG